MEVPLPGLRYGEEADVSEGDVDRPVPSCGHPGNRAGACPANGRKMDVDPGDDRPHHEVFPDAGPLTLRSLTLRADRQPTRWHHDDERTCGPVSNERIGNVRESQAD